MRRDHLELHEWMARRNVFAGGRVLLGHQQCRLVVRARRHELSRLPGLGRAPFRHAVLGQPGSRVRSPLRPLGSRAHRPLLDRVRSKRSGGLVLRARACRTTVGPSDGARPRGRRTVGLSPAGPLLANGPQGQLWWSRLSFTA